MNSTAHTAYVDAQKRNLRLMIVFGSLYWPFVLLPLFYWRWRVASLPVLLGALVSLSVVCFVPICCLGFLLMCARYMRQRLMAGFGIYAACYLGGNEFGLVGGRWYWLHGTMLSFVLCTGMLITQSRAKKEAPILTSLIKLGHWTVALSFFALVYFRAHLHSLIVWDYLVGSYFSWCLWTVAKLPGVTELEE